MDKSKVKIHYIYHSGFAVETSNHLLIFDYYKEPNYNGSDQLILENLIKNNVNVLVFSSHSHDDHFNPVILEWTKINPSIKYILSSDITPKAWEDNYYKLFQYEELFLKTDLIGSKTPIVENHTSKEINESIKDIYIKAYGSTDIGISFLVKVDDIDIFHAGDLNWWHWKEDSDEERNIAEQNFKMEISKIKGEHIDIAFFPVDPRLEEFYSIGAEYFIKELHPDTLIPMHFGDSPYITKQFAQKEVDLPTKIVVITNPGDELNI